MIRRILEMTLLLPALLVPGLVISVIGFAEGVSISRVFASQTRRSSSSM